MPELLWNVLACIGLLCVLCTMLLGAWFVIAADRQDAHWPDDPPTLDVQNHLGDARPVDLPEPLDRFEVARIRVRIGLMAKGYFG